MKEINVSWRQNPFLDVHDNTRIALGFSFSFVSLLSFVTPPSSNSYIIATNYLGAILFYLIYRYNFFLLSFELESISCCFNFREGYWRRLSWLILFLAKQFTLWSNRLWKFSTWGNMHIIFFLLRFDHYTFPFLSSTFYFIHPWFLL